jgi:arylsulfatase A-like enzyme
MLVTDHPHLFETGGENYHVDFTAWDYQRGHESDPWKTRPDPSWLGAPEVPVQRDIRAMQMPYARSRTWFRGEDDFPGPKTMAAAAQWLETNAGQHDRFLLFVDEFDPHEPFDTPEPYASAYDPHWQGPHLIWPPYQRGAIESGALTEAEARQVRACYGAKLTMIDHWFGRVIDALDREQLWDDTVVIVCTDHGHYLGEKDIWGKPSVPVYEPMGHIPMLVRWPGVAPRIIDALTTSVDVFATLADIFGVRAAHVTHGFSLKPLILGETDAIRDHVLTGVWGREIHVVDEHMKYARAPGGANAPLSMWSNRWSTMPVAAAPDLVRLPLPDDRAMLDRMPGSTVPVLRQPFEAGDALPYWAGGDFSGSHLFDLLDDPDEEHNLAGSAIEKEAADKLRECLVAVTAPADQFVRLGLA